MICIVNINIRRFNIRNLDNNIISYTKIISSKCVSRNNSTNLPQIIFLQFHTQPLNFNKSNCFIIFASSSRLSANWRLSSSL